MKMSQLFGHTLRDAPGDAEIASHRLLIRAGYIRPLGSGIYSYLHLAKRSMQKIERILREEMDHIGGQEICMPVVHPADLWKQSGRWQQVGPELVRFKDRNEHDLVLAMTHEEVIGDLIRQEVHSYKDLPRTLYHIQTKFRDEPRPRGGLLRVREFTMKDSYSLDTDCEGLDKQYQLHHEAYQNIFRRCALKVIAVRSDVGMMGGSMAHEFMYLSPIGEDILLICAHCGYSANQQIAKFQKVAPPSEEHLALSKVRTPDCKSIDQLASFLGTPKSRTAKAVFMVATVHEESDKHEKFVFAIIRGDMTINESKLTKAIGAYDLRPATDPEIERFGIVPGFASPINLPEKTNRQDMVILVDDLVPNSPNLAAGANEVNHHFINTNYPRDYQVDLVADIASAQEGYPCPDCGEPLTQVRGVEVGNIFKLGTRYSDRFGCTYTDAKGENKPVVMGSYGIGVGRLLACIAEEHHDINGLTWPVSIAPYHVHLVLLRGGEGKLAEKLSEELYSDFQHGGMEVLYDDREESPGVKFKDADLIGLPIRITISEKSLNRGGIELKLRTGEEKTIIDPDGVLSRVDRILEELKMELSQKDNSPGDCYSLIQK